VSFAAIIVCVFCERVFILLSTQFGDFWIHPRILHVFIYMMTSRLQFMNVLMKTMNVAVLI